MTDNRTTELLPCPFCGGEAEKLTSIDGFTSIGCLNCNPYYGVMIQRNTEAEAIAAWNTRVELGSGTCTMSIGKSRIGDDEIESFVCSICGYETFRQYTFGNDGEFVSYPEPNYCPHCGALRSWAND